MGCKGRQGQAREGKGNQEESAYPMRSLVGQPIGKGGSYIHTDKQKDIQTDTHRQAHTYINTYIQTHRQPGSHTARQTGRQTDI